MPDRNAGELSEPPTRSQLCFTADALDELARARGVAAAEALELVAAWLRRVAAPSRSSSGESDGCECGAALAHVAGAGVSAVLCPRCDAERLHELAEPDLEGELYLSVELAKLGKEAARDAWVQHAGDARAVPSYPALSAWRQLGAALGLLESDRVLDSGERLVFVQAYQNELRALAAGSRQHARGLTLPEALLALCLTVLTGCASAHGRIEGPPLYVHLCDAMPAADQEAWGAAAAALNAEIEQPAVWVGHGEPDSCSTVDVCPSGDVLADAEVDLGTCVITVRYAPGAAREVAAQELRSILAELRAEAPRSAALDGALQVAPAGWQAPTLPTTCTCSTTAQTTPRASSARSSTHGTNRRVSRCWCCATSRQRGAAAST